MPAGDTILGYDRSYKQELEPTDTRVEGDEWLQTSTGITYKWYTSATGGGGWVAFDNAEDAGASPLVTANDIEVTDATKGLVLSSPNGTRWRVTVNNSGALVVTSL